MTKIIDKPENKPKKAASRPVGKGRKNRIEAESEDYYLGQFIPLHYHHNMLLDPVRMGGFKAAIDYAVKEGGKVLELGGGTGVLSCFAAAKAEKVWCVEFNPELVEEARRFLKLNKDGHKVEVIHADAFDYLPPEPVDVVICEMLHVGLLREKFVEVIEGFKERYRRRFGDRLPVFMPEAVVLAVQPLEQSYDFSGYRAPVIIFQNPQAVQAGSVEMSQPIAYHILDVAGPLPREISWHGDFVMDKDGAVNALRFITKNLLAIVPKSSSTIDWLMNYLVLPLGGDVPVKAGETLSVSFKYLSGGSIRVLEKSMKASVLR